MNKIIISIEGNIGAGKSTFLKILKLNLEKIKIIEEPLIKWQNIEQDGINYNILDMYYKDPKRWAYTFQTYAFYSRF